MGDQDMEDDEDPLMGWTEKHMVDDDSDDEEDERTMLGEQIR